MEDDDEYEARDDDQMNMDDNDNDDNDELPPAPPAPPAPPQINRPGLATRAMMKLVGFKPPEVKIPKRPAEYKIYKKK